MIILLNKLKECCQIYAPMHSNQMMAKVGEFGRRGLGRGAGLGARRILGSVHKVALTSRSQFPSTNSLSLNRCRTIRMTLLCPYLVSGTTPRLL